MKRHFISITDLDVDEIHLEMAQIGQQFLGFVKFFALQHQHAMAVFGEDGRRTRAGRAAADNDRIKSIFNLGHMWVQTCP